MALRYAPEIWRDVPDYVGLYQVSNLGRVKSLDRDLKGGAGSKGIRTYKGKVLNQENMKAGYRGIRLWVNGKSKRYSAHQLVALAFIPNPDDKRTVNHINGCKTDNNVCNLEWHTYSENLIHAFDTNLKSNPKGSNCSWSKLTEADVRQIKLLLNQKVKGVDIAKQFNTTSSNIYAIKNGKSWNHIK